MLNAWSNPTGRRLILIVTLSLFLLSFGTVGYMMVGQFSFLDALYMTVITVTTVGYQEVRPLDAGGRLFTIIFIFMSIGFVAYNVAYFAQLLMDANWFALYRKRRVRNMLKQVQDHYIICGYGQMGKVIVDELLQQRNVFRLAVGGQARDFALVLHRFVAAHVGDVGVVVAQRMVGRGLVQVR